MEMTLVKYRTNSETETDVMVIGPTKTEYVVIPNIWLSDLLQWLSDIKAEVLSTTDNCDHAPILPINWPSYETCKYCITVSDVLADVVL